MTVQLAFWIVMLLWFIFGAWDGVRTKAAPSGGSVLAFLAVLLLGWATLGAPIK